MQQLSPTGRNAVSEIAGRYGISPETVEHMLVAVSDGGGSMAQFNCPELGGSGQWMRGGMTMVGDMFNHGLKSTVDRLCSELSDLLAGEPVFTAESENSRSKSQWWPMDLGTPLSTGSQNKIRYALFTGRLAVDVDGDVTVYDTLDHRIGGVSQQQGGNTSLTFTSQYGTVALSSLPVVSGTGEKPAPSTNFAASAVKKSSPVQELDRAIPESGIPEQDGSGTAGRGKTVSESAISHGSGDVTGGELLELIDKMAKLRDAGVLSEEEFSAKKRELLARL